jgi:glutaredoxin-like protein DUF836
MSSRVVVFTAPGCHLCGPAVEAVRSVCGSDFELVDISSDTELERRYRIRIPVVEVDGLERFRYEVDPEALREALDRPSARDTPA